MIKYLNLLFGLSILVPQIASAQVEENAKLFTELQLMDRLLFEEGFNNCNLAVVDSIVFHDFEFYHDQNGVQDKAMFLKGFKESLCSTPDRKPIRKLVAGSLKVFPLYDSGKLYGAIQNGIHEFYIKEPDKELYKTNIAKFTSLWVLKNDNWLLKRVLSYDHQTPK